MGSGSEEDEKEDKGDMKTKGARPSKEVSGTTSWFSLIFVSTVPLVANCAAFHSVSCLNAHVSASACQNKALYRRAARQWLSSPESTRFVSGFSPSSQLQAAMSYDDDLHHSIDDSLLPIIVIVAVFLIVAANGWISQLMGNEKTKSGLADFLKDGKGYNKSGFSLSDTERAVSSDPLPWLRLPRLDFVEVAGQERALTEEQILAKLESMRARMSKELADGNISEAERLGKELESVLNEGGIEFKVEKSWE
jgi:hypothetical protein